MGKYKNLIENIDFYCPYSSMFKLMGLHKSGASKGIKI